MAEGSGVFPVLNNRPPVGIVRGQKGRTMKATVKIKKTFDDGKEFSKEWDNGDFKEFFNDEGEYLDRLAGVVSDRGEIGEGFTVTYTVILTK